MTQTYSRDGVTIVVANDHRVTVTIDGATVHDGVVGRPSEPEQDAFTALSIVQSVAASTVPEARQTSPCAPLIFAAGLDVVRAAHDRIEQLRWDIVNDAVSLMRCDATWIKLSPRREYPQGEPTVRCTSTATHLYQHEPTQGQQQGQVLSRLLCDKHARSIPAADERQMRDVVIRVVPLAHSCAVVGG